MLQVTAYQHQFQVVDIFYMVTHHAPGAFGILNKIQLKFFMVVQGKIKSRFYTGKNGKAVALCQWRDLPQ
jgi:hypothetical protein